MDLVVQMDYLRRNASWFGHEGGQMAKKDFSVDLNG